MRSSEGDDVDEIVVVEIKSACWVRQTKGLGAENFETLRYPTQVPINIQIWMSQGCSNLEVLSTFGLIS